MGSKCCKASGAGVCHTGQAGTDQTWSVPVPKASSRHGEAAPASFNTHTKPFLGVTHRKVPIAAATGYVTHQHGKGRSGWHFQEKNKALLAWRAPQRLTSLCSASLCNSRQVLATLQLLQPFFISPFSSGLGQPSSSAAINLWDELGAGGAPGPGHCSGGPGQPPRAGRGGLSHPSACSSSFWQGHSQL